MMCTRGHGAAAAALATFLAASSFIGFCGPWFASGTGLRGGNVAIKDLQPQRVADAFVRRLEQGEGEEEGRNLILESLLRGLLPLILGCCCCLQILAYFHRKGVADDLEDDANVDNFPRDMYGPEITLKQTFRATEQCGCEAKNRYIAQPDGRLYIRETSDCCHRLFSSVNRELTLWVHAGPSEEAPVVLRMFKPFHLQGCCFCRPSLEVELPNGTEIGTIKDPFKCCTMDQQVFDANQNLRFSVAGSLCQCGICCPCCSDVNFDIDDEDGNTVGEISKKALTCGEICMKTNRFMIDFPKQCSIDDKHLLLGSAMLLDLQYFETKK
eukprot:TRINITY_DN76469_c0_g1_i1.p1 TRINITY_DN76469_c0_g1~~TRINITY_DN76469_c0_g1_i1.p1  ORF type:complete len:326 (+),score=61.59 TRINITY_DN76469_c0_g1_i1:69-1046(+)